MRWAVLLVIVGTVQIDNSGMECKQYRVVSRVNNHWNEHTQHVVTLTELHSVQSEDMTGTTAW